MNAAKIVTLKEIADHLGVKEQRVGEWITLRIHKPGGETVFKLLAFAADKTLHINHRPELRERYRHAFEAACMKFPTKGEK